LDFVEEKEIDSKYFEKPYFLEPDKGAEKPYALFREALKKTGKGGVAKFVFRNREHIGLVKQEGEGIILNQLRYKAEIREPEDLNFPGRELATEKEVEMAITLINHFSRPFKPEEYHDTYYEELMRIIDEKAKGRQPVYRGKPPIPTPAKDLMAILKESLEKPKERVR